jgi:Fic family protein
LTIHPFEDGNGRTARLLVDYLLDQYGYGFGRIGALEEYFAYDIDAYYRSLQMGLPALCYSGRLDPPHPEIWVTYFLKMVLLHARKAVELASAPEAQQAVAGYSYLNYKERIFLKTLVKEKRTAFTPIEMSKQFSVTNRTIINWCATLCKNGFLKPVTSGSRVRFYTMTSLTLGLSPDELN